MPKPHEHWNQAEHNKSLIAAIRSQGANDWATTVAFYSALHYFQAVMAKRGQPPKNHKERRAAAKKHLPTAEAIDYVNLQNESEKARYFATANEADALPAGQTPAVYYDEVAAEMFEEKVERIRKRCDMLMQK